MDDAFRASIAIDARLHKASFGGDRSAAGRYAAEQRWKGHVKQSVGRNDKDSSDKLSLDELKTVLESAKNVVEAHQMIAERLGKTMKPKVEDLSDDEINAWRSISDNGAKRLVEGEILNAEFATYGQGLYVMMAGQADGGMTKEDAKYRTLYYGKNMVGLRLSESAKIVDGAKKSFSLKAADARKEIEKTGSVRLVTFYSHGDFHNLYWASQGFDGWVPYGRKMGGEVVFFNAEHLSVNSADLPPQVANRKVKKSFIRRDAMVDLALDKASFGGDRSAAGRYAAEQRWKGHVKRQTRTGGNRSTDEQLSQGPQNLAFGRDKNGLPIVGTRKELEEKYGKTDKQRREYFQNKYGVTVKFADSDRYKGADAIQAKLGAVQALDDILSNLNVIPVGLTQKPPISTIQIGTQNPMRSPFTNQIPVAFVSHDSVDSRKFLLALDTAEAAAIVPYLLSKTTPITEEDASLDDDESPLDVINLRRLQETSNESVASRFGVTDANRDKRTPTREDEASIARRLGYAIMVHEWGHVLDTQSFFDAKQRAGVKDMTSDRSDKDDSSTFSQTQPVSEYGRFNVWEKQAEGFTAWFLFSQSTNQVLIYSPKTNVGFSEASRWLKEQTVVDMKGLISPTMRPLLDSLRPPQTGEQVLKQVTDYVTTVADLPFDHPVVVFALQEFVDDGLAKARVRVDAMVEAALMKASFGGDRSAAGRYAAEQRWKGHQKKDEMPKPTGFIGVRRPSKRQDISADGKEPYPSSMSGLQLTTMLEDDMKEMNDQKGLWQDRRKDGSLIIGRNVTANLDTPANRRLAKQTLVEDLTKGVLASLPPEVILTAVYELDPNAPSQVVAVTATEAEGTDPITFKENVYDCIDQIIGQWAESSNDSLRLSLAIQQVAQRVFGLEQSAPASVIGDNNKEADQQAKTLSDPESASGKLLEAVIRQQYANTQAYFAAKGIKEVILFRGKQDEDLAGRAAQEVANREPPDGIARAYEGLKQQSVSLRPLSSFTSREKTATDFAEASESESGGDSDLGVVLTVRVPVSQVFSTPFTGIGCLPETEFVLLGKPTTADVRLWDDV